MGDCLLHARQNVKIKILDLPIQLAVCKQNAEEKHLLSRIDFHPINLLDTSQAIPQGADAIWMSQFLDCFSEKEILNILLYQTNSGFRKLVVSQAEPLGSM